MLTTQTSITTRRSLVPWAPFAASSAELSQTPGLLSAATASSSAVNHRKFKSLRCNRPAVAARPRPQAYGANPPLFCTKSHFRQLIYLAENVRSW